MRLLPWTLAVLVLSAFSILLSESGAIDPVQNVSLTMTSPLTAGIRDLADPAADFLTGILDRGDIVDENERLREELERLQGRVAAGEDAQRRVRELEEALGVRETRPQDEFIAADVIAEDPSDLKRALAINRGSGDGLDEGMVVLSKSGSLVGTISRVYDDFAWIRLVTDPNSAVNAVVLTGDEQEEASAARGVATGELRRDLSLDMLAPDSGIEEGDLVMTSGLGGNYPRALLLGSVTSVESRPQATFTSARVKPAADLGSIETVLIIANFKPARLSGP
jgi:rod shape-determining protein MreC